MTAPHPPEAHDRLVLELRPNVWAYLRDHSLFVVVPVAALAVVAFDRELRLLRQPIYPLAVLVALYLVGYLRFLLQAPGYLRLTPHGVEWNDRSDNLYQRSLRWAELQRYYFAGGWTPTLRLRTYQGRTYRLRALGLEGTAWAAFETQFTALADAQGIGHGR
ncbi:MAG: hypothetical protein SFY70_07120 [Bacteroidia bacterium]|nr:hypothetical protein [Bacteroidia bacterium]